MFRFWILNGRGSFPRVLSSSGPKGSQGPEVLGVPGVHRILRYWGSWGLQRSRESQGPKTWSHFSTMPPSFCSLFLYVFYENLIIRYGRKVGPSTGTPRPSRPLGLPGPLGPPRLLGLLGPTEPLGPPGPLGPSYLATASISGSHGPLGPPGPLDPWTPWDLRTLGKLPLPFEIQNLNTVYLICCKKYRNEVSHRYGSVVFLAKV